MTFTIYCIHDPYFTQNESKDRIRLQLSTFLKLNQKKFKYDLYHKWCQLLIEKNLALLQEARFFSQGLILRVFQPAGWRIFIPDNSCPFGNCIPLRVNQAIFLFHLLWFDDFFGFLQKIKNNRSQSKTKKLVKSQQTLRFLHGSCGNQKYAWAMWKSDFFSLV